MSSVVLNEIHGSKSESDSTSEDSEGERSPGGGEKKKQKYRPRDDNETINEIQSNWGAVQAKTPPKKGGKRGPGQQAGAAANIPGWPPPAGGRPPQPGWPPGGGQPGWGGGPAFPPGGGQPGWPPAGGQPGWGGGQPVLMSSYEDMSVQ
ncbi:hypothetical protein OSTOST_09502 [Ostertagia ostertagi]